MPLVCMRMPDDEARIAEQRVLHLRQPIARIVGVKSLVDDHLLAVVRPPFAVGRGAEHLANVGWKVSRVEKLQIVSGPHFVHRHVRNRRVIPLRHELVLLRRRRLRIGQRHVVVRLGRHRLERPRNIHRRRRRGAQERRRLLHARRRGLRNRDDALLGHEPCRAHRARLASSTAASPPEDDRPRAS